jgi:hypothetical protein
MEKVHPKVVGSQLFGHSELGQERWNCHSSVVGVFGKIVQHVGEMPAVGGGLVPKADSEP